ncbi:transglutaminase-like cysteine peptidase [Colwellia sp. E2M01]|uniref:transglutaminase-like cysteine peptidase n=1 Tax=Colwellia sp. E2M01 TaxID=2841561 RepID=UPI001C093E2A|nr:transglutaminase-like cysteine peptidase [Colwellia sp. E2M01]MBU2872368.1 transglutaminase-like cysteine peptidase [Colwellia sp. E2M01]
MNAILHAKKTTKLDEAQIVNALTSNYGERAGKRGKAWVQLIDKSYPLDDDNKLEKVNNFFNQLHFTSDIRLWGESNYWATPLEFLGANAGDCEDFAIAKYFTLLELGVPDEKMRITMVKAVTLNQYHMVVAYYHTPGSIPVILDNIIGSIKPATERKDLIPVYSFNGKQLWLNKKKNQGVLAGKSQRLKQWTDLNQRMGILNMKQPKLRME